MTRTQVFINCFSLDRIALEMEELASKNPIPSASELVQALVKGRRDDGPNTKALNYPPALGLDLLGGALCVLKASDRTSAEFRLGITSDYLCQFNKSGQDTMDDLFRDVCIDISRAQLASLENGHLGIAMVSILHLGTQEDSEANKICKALEALAKATSINLERHQFNYVAQGHGPSAKGVVDLFVFHRCFRRESVRNFKVCLESGEEIQVQGHRLITVSSRDAGEFAVEIWMDDENDPTPGGQRRTTVAAFPYDKIKAVFSDGKPHPY